MINYPFLILIIPKRSVFNKKNKFDNRNPNLYLGQAQQM